MCRLKEENAQMKYELERLQQKLDQQSIKDNDKLRRMEESKRQSDHDLRHLKESRGKIFRGLNTQTEIAMVQFKRDFENLKKQLEAKDAIISIQDKKIASLVEANRTLRSGFQELNSLPAHSSDSDLDEDEENSYMPSGILNGHGVIPGSMPNYNSHDDPSGVNPDLLRVISQLGSGKFDN